MSETVDNRVVEMQFDNKNFETNVKTSLSTLEKLKQSLNLKGASKGLEGVQAAASKCDLSGLSNGITTVQSHFSALQIAGVTALATITNQAVLAGERMIKALTLTPVIDGYKEYETQMNAVQTILANTQKEGTNVAIVNKYLDELNTYADKTIYNFTEMTRNIGTFTAAGVKLDTSVSSIKGIANLAAVSGSTSQQASTAMYQLSQAIASGTVKLMDWNSVVNAGMGGQVFQDALIRTSEHLQTGAKAAISAKGSFRESLSTGWLTVDVLTQTLDQFATAADTQEEYEAAVKKFVEQGYTQEEAKQMADMAKTAGDAATKVKTFTQLIDTLKEALGSGWTKTWQLIIGDFEEARSLWTSVSDVLSEIINSVSDARNQLLESALGKSFSGLYESITGVIEPALEVADTVDEVVESVTDLGAVVDDVILGKFGNGQERFDALTAAGQNYYRVQNKVNETLGNSYRYTDEQIAAQDKLLGVQQKTTTATNKSSSATNKLTNAQKKQLKQLTKLSDEQLRSKGYTEEQIKAFQELRDTAEKLGMPLDDFIDKLDEINGRWLLIDSFKNIGKTLSSVFEAVAKAFREVFDPIQPEQIFDAIAGFHKLTASMVPSVETCDKLTRTFKGLFAAIDLVTTILGGGFKIAFKIVSALLEGVGVTFLDVTATVGDMVYKFNEWFQDNVFVKFIEMIVEKIPEVIDGIKDFIDSLNIGEGASNAFKTVCEGVSAAIDILHGAFTRSFNSTLKIISSVLSIFGTDLAGVIAKIAECVIKVRDWLATNTLFIDSISKISNIIVALIEGVASLVEKFAGLKPVREFFENLKNTVKSFFESFDFNFDGGFLDGIVDGINSIIDKISEWLDTLGDSEHFGLDLVTGLVNGIRAGIDMVINGVIDLATSIVDTICGFLGIHSPSTVMFGIGENIIQGLTNGISSAIDSIWEVISNIGQGIVDMFNNIAEFDWKSLTINIGNGVKSVFTNIGTILSGIGQGIAEFVSNISWSDVTNAIQNGVSFIFSTVFSVIRSIFAGIGQSLYENFGGIWDTIVGFFSNLDWGVIATAVSAGGMLALAWKLIPVLEKIANIGNTITKPLQSLDKVINSIGNSINKYIDARAWAVKADAMKSIAVAIGIVAASIYLLSKIENTDALWNGVAAIAVIAAVLGGVLVGMNILITKFGTMEGNAEKNLAGTAKLASMLLSLGVVFLAFAATIKILSSVDDAGMDRALKAIIALGAFVTVLTLVACIDVGAKDFSGVTKVLLGASVMLIAMGVVVKILGEMDTAVLEQGIIAVYELGILVAALMILAGGIDKADGIGNVGNTLLESAASIAVLAVVVKMLGGMNTAELEQGILAVYYLGILVAALIAVCGSIDKSKGLTGAGTTLLAAALSIGIMAAAVKLIGNASEEELEQGIRYVAGLGALVIMMLYVTQFAQGAKGAATTLLAMTLSIGILAGICVLLGMIDPATVWKGIAAVSVLVILVSLMTVATAFTGSSNDKAIRNLAISIGVLVAAVVVLSFVDTAKLWSSVAALSALMLVFSVVEAAAGKTGNGSYKAILTLSLVIGVLAGALYLLAGLPCESTLGAAVSLSITLLTLSACLKIIGTVGTVSKKALTAVLALTGVVALLAIVLGALTALDCAPSIETAASLSLLLMALTVSVGLLSIMGVSASAALPGIGVMAAVVVALGALIVALGALNKYVPELQSFLDGGIAVLQKIGEAIGAFFGGIVGGFANGVADSLPKLGESLSAFAIALTPFMTMMSIMPDDLPGKVALLSGAIIALTAAELINGVASLIPFLPDMASMGADLSAFAIALLPFISVMNMLDDTAVAACGKLAELVLSLTAAELLEGITSFITGGQDFASFGNKLASLGTGVSQFMTSMAGVDPAEVSTKADAVKILCEAVSQIPTTGGLWGLIAGEKDIDGFGMQLAALGAGVAMFMTSMANVSTEGAAEKAEAVKSLCEAASQIPTTGGLWGMIAGDQDAGEFGNQLAALGEGVATFAEKTAGITADGIEPAKQAIQACIDISGMIPEDAGLFEKIGNFFMGGDDNISFIDKLVPLGTSLKSFSDAISGFDPVAVAMSVSGIKALKTIGEMLDGIDIEIEDDSLSFVSKLTPFAGYMKRYGATVAGIDASSITSSVSCVNAIVKVGDKVAKSNITLTSDQISFVKYLIPLADGMKQYSARIAGTDYASISESVTAARSLVRLINTTSGINTSGVASFISAVKDLGNVSFDSITKAFSGAPEALKNMGSTLTNSLATGMKTNQVAVIAATQNVISSAVNAITSNTSTFQNGGNKLASGAATGIGRGKSAVNSASASIVSGASSILKSYYSSFSGAGSYVAGGFASGIRSAISSVASSAISMASSAINSAKKALQINSPSKVFKKIGSGVPEGFAMGIGMFGERIKDSVTSMSNTAIDTTKGVIAHLSDVLTVADLDSQPTIRPVVDLSNVESGAAAINGMFNSDDFAIGTKMNLNAIGMTMNRRNQNGVNEDVVSAIDKLRKDVGNLENRSYSIGGITYSADDEVSNAIETLVRAVRVEGRV